MQIYTVCNVADPPADATPYQDAAKSGPPKKRGGRYEGKSRSLIAAADSAALTMGCRAPARKPRDPLGLEKPFELGFVEDGDA